MTEQAATIWSLVGQILMIMLAGGGVIFLEQIRQRLKEWYKQRKLHPIARSVLANKTVNSLLIELRATTEADRSAVFLFHNGQTFSNKNPLWRMSCTQECCRMGVSHEIGSMQNMLASLFWDGLAPLFGQDSDLAPGISHFIAFRGQRAYKIEVHKMNDSYYKRSLLVRGVKVAYCTPISDAHKEIVGYVSLNYCSDFEPVAEEILATLVEAAGNIHYALTDT